MQNRYAEVCALSIVEIRFIAARGFLMLKPLQWKHIRGRSWSAAHWSGCRFAICIYLVVKTLQIFSIFLSAAQHHR
jgi:hypothetical protein